MGVHLSGGLDSSSIAVLAARELHRRGRPPPLAFSCLPVLDGEAPAPAHAKEYALIDAVCAQEDLQVSHCALSPGDVVAVLRRDGAFPGVHVQVNEEAVQRGAAASGVRVLLSGWGGDEGVSFNGQGHREQLLLGGRWLRLAAECRADPHPFRTLAHVALSLVHPRLRNHLRRRLRGEEPRRRRWLIDPAFARRAKPLSDEVFRPIGVRRTQARLLRNGHLSQRIEGWAECCAEQDFLCQHDSSFRRQYTLVLLQDGDGSDGQEVELPRSHSRSGADAFGFVSNPTASHAASSQPWNTTANPMYRTDGARRRRPSSAR